jgi:hypothetical protein
MAHGASHGASSFVYFYYLAVGSCLELRAVQTQNLKTQHRALDQRMFSWALYVLGQDIDEVWWPTDLVSGYTRGPECRTNSTCT